MRINTHTAGTNRRVKVVQSSISLVLDLGRPPRGFRPLHQGSGTANPTLIHALLQNPMSPGNPKGRVVPIQHLAYAASKLYLKDAYRSKLFAERGDLMLHGSWSWARSRAEMPDPVRQQSCSGHMERLIMALDAVFCTKTGTSTISLRWPA